ncbi:MAG: arylsulfatase [Planctomycetota bacterium]|jgi:arylsulfatase
MMCYVSPMRTLRRLGALVLFLSACAAPPPDPPNLVYILADDLGFGELGSYGQTRIRTPHLDRLAAEGMRFTQHYSGSPVCAPSRATLLTGLHTGHAEIRDNDEMGERGDVWNDPDLEGQRPLSDGARTLGEVLQDRGYVTAAIGKWGLGWVGSEGDPNRQGFDHFYGYICQREAHNYYPTHLWRDGAKHVLDNERFSPHQRLPDDADPTLAASYDAYRGGDYAMDHLTDDALGFVREHRDERFFLYLAYPVPHLALQVPDEDLREYAGAFDETPYRGDRGYLPHPTPRAAYAAMITRMDSDIGRLMALLADLGLDENTLVVFASDNGPSWVGGVDREFFDSSGGLRGRKAQLYEGGIRVPMIARWPGRVAPGSVSDHVSAFWDVLPTFAELAGAPTPAALDGLSMVPTLLGRPHEQTAHELLYWEHARAQQAIRVGDWKAHRKRPGDPIELYDLSSDPGEQHDVAARHPEVVARLTALMRDARTPSEHFPLKSP